MLKISNLATKIVALERREEFLTTQIAERGGSDTALSFMRAELSGIRAGLDALRFHRIKLEGIDDQLAVLRELAEEFSGFAKTDDQRQALAKARVILSEFNA